MADQRRVVITGTGVRACNGSDTASFVEALKAGRHGIAPITGLPGIEAHGTRFGGAVPLDNETLAGDRRVARRKDRFVLLALAAAREALDMAGLTPESWEDPFKVAVIVGAGIGGLQTIEDEYSTFLERGPRRVSPFMVPKMIVDSAAGDISIIAGAKGPNYCITTACASASHSIGAAFHHIRSGLCDAAVTGGAEAPLTQIAIAGFNSIKALSTRNDSPETASRPFDKDRDGFVMAEGAGILILEELEHAKARGATIYGEIVGYGCTGDAHHETAPDPEGTAGIACMRMALADAGIEPEQVGYVNAHGTSTPLNDKTETGIIKGTFGEHATNLLINSTKSMTGHTLGAAGAIEGIATIWQMRDGFIHPTINYTTPDPDCDLNYVPNEGREATVDYALSNNLGFGGHNASLIFRRYSD